jgi:ubiquinone/menaquinone biosynthesis C-methylase UbiE
MKNESYIPALSYEWLTPFYDTVVRLTTREKIFKKALNDQARIKANHQVLDLACGTGTLTILIKQSQPQAKVIGIDGDAKILAIAASKTKAAGLSIEFDEGMSYDLPYPDHTFDRVVSSLFFHHLTRENKLQTLREVYRVLKPNGEFHVADWGLPANPLMRGASYLIQLLDGFETTADSFNGLLPILLTQAGLEKVEETRAFNTMFGTIRLHKSSKTP